MKNDKAAKGKAQVEEESEEEEVAEASDDSEEEAEQPVRKPAARNPPPPQQRAPPATPPRQTAPPRAPPDLKAYEQMIQLGYPRYTFATSFEQLDLNTDPRTYPVSKRVEVLKLTEENGQAPYVALGFVGLLDEKLFLIVMEREMVKRALDDVSDPTPYVGLEFTGVSKRFGPVGFVALSKAAYEKLAEVVGR